MSNDGKNKNVRAGNKGALLRAGFAICESGVLKNLKLTEMKVLFFLYVHSKFDTCCSWYATARIGKAIGVLPANVSTAMRGLEKKGLIETVVDEGGKRRTATRKIIIPTSPMSGESVPATQTLCDGTGSALSGNGKPIVEKGEMLCHDKDEHIEHQNNVKKTYKTVVPIPSEGGVREEEKDGVIKHDWFAEREKELLDDATEAFTNMGVALDLVEKVAEEKGVDFLKLLLEQIQQQIGRGNISWPKAYATKMVKNFNKVRFDHDVQKHVDEIAVRRHEDEKDPVLRKYFLDVEKDAARVATRDCWPATRHEQKGCYDPDATGFEQNDVDYEGFDEQAVHDDLMAARAEEGRQERFFGHE